MNSMKLSQLKQQIEELDAKATKGPWESVVNHAPYKVVVIDEEEYYTTLELKPDDGDFIALSRTAMPELLRRLLVAEGALDRIKRLVWWMQEDQRRNTGSINGVSGAQAVALSNDPNYLRKIATAALKTIRGEEE